MIRLNKYLAHQTGISRREADSLISSGKVYINSQLATLGQTVSPGQDTITINGKPVNSTQAYTYLLLNKPVGYVCSRRQQGNTPTIYSLLPASLAQLKTVGRLDADSSGLIILTDDGDFAHQMTHPSFYKNKTYQVALNKPLAPLHHQMINDYGLQLPDGPSKLQLSRMADGDDHNWVVQMHEGRNRQIRRTFAALGYIVTALHRTSFGNYTLGSLKPGQHKTTKKL